MIRIRAGFGRDPSFRGRCIRTTRPPPPASRPEPGRGSRTEPRVWRREIACVPRYTDEGISSDSAGSRAFRRTPRAPHARGSRELKSHEATDANARVLYEFSRFRTSQAGDDLFASRENLRLQPCLRIPCGVGRCKICGSLSQPVNGERTPPTYFAPIPCGPSRNSLPHP